MEEIWKKVNIPRFKDFYEVSNFGNIRSVDRTTYIKRKRKGKNQFFNHSFKGMPLIPYIDKYGYKRVCLHHDGIQESQIAIHHLVALTFLGEPPTKIGQSSESSQINHKNGIKGDNRVVNLEWCTPKENIRHGWHKGLINLSQFWRGEQIGTSKLTEDDVREIRFQYKSGKKCCELGRTFGVTRANINHIIHRKTWKHI